MRYLSSISLALVVLMALACTATPTPTPTVTPTGPLISEAEAIAVVKSHLSLKPYYGTRSCLYYLYDAEWQAKYVGDGVWEAWATLPEHPEDKRLMWDVYEKTASAVATGKFQKEQGGWLSSDCFDLIVGDDNRR